MFLAFTLFVLQAKAQDDGYLEFRGKTFADQKPLAGAHIIVYKNGNQKYRELTTTKNGKFTFDLEFGVDYKVSFTAPGFVDMHLMIYASKVAVGKMIYPVYEIDVPFFENNKTTINVAKFKNPFTKVIYDGKKSFTDDEKYLAEFTSNIFVYPDEELKKQEEKLAAEKLEQEKLRKEQELLAEKKAKEEEEALKKLMEEKYKEEQKNAAKNAITQKQNENNENMLSEEVKLTLEKEKKKQEEKKNQAIKADYENDLIKLVAENDKQTKSATYTKQKQEAQANEVIETLKREAETKAKADEIRYGVKSRNKQAVVNAQIKNNEITSLIKTAAINDRKMKTTGTKTYPVVADFKAKALVSVKTKVDNAAFKTIYEVTVISNKITTIYRKERYNWGLVYYYKNDKEITKEEYLNALTIYNIPL